MFKSLAIATLAAGGTAGAATFVPMSADAPMTQFVTCDVTAHGHGVFGGRVIVGTDERTGAEYVLELVGPLAATHIGAQQAARQMDLVVDGDDRCEPTAMDEIWQLGAPRCHPARPAAARWGC